MKTTTITQALQNQSKVFRVTGDPSYLGSDMTGLQSNRPTLGQVVSGCILYRSSPTALHLEISGTLMVDLLCRRER